MGYDVLIIDDEKDIRELVSEILQDEGYSTRTAKDADTTFAALDERVPAVVVLDIWLQGSHLDGLGILEIINNKYPDVPVIMISGHGNIETAINAIKMGAYDYIEKPFKEDKLLVVVKHAVEKTKLQSENKELKVRGVVESELIGSSVAINKVNSAINKAAPNEGRVMVSGPSGVGKEVVARLIHKKSKRSEGPFVILNAAGINYKIEQELFGIEDKEKFSDKKRKVGLLEKAHGGTLFIDEIADMDLSSQNRLIKFLRDGDFTRVNGESKVVVDVRIISATSKDIEQEVASGRLLKDLLYRLNVISIDIPALKDRKEDIAPLVKYFSKRCAEVSGLNEKEISKDAIVALQGYGWPGNTRQLRNVIEWLLIMATSSNEDVISSSSLPPEILEYAEKEDINEVSNEIMSLPIKSAREVFEKNYLVGQLNRFDGNISKTALFIGMERSALHRKLKSLGVLSEDKKENVA